MSILDPRCTLTKRSIMRALEGFPDDEPIMINVEFEDNITNWDTFHAVMANWSEMCPGGYGCTHTEPEMRWESVLFVKFGNPDNWIIDPETVNPESPRT